MPSIGNRKSWIVMCAMCVLVLCVATVPGQDAGGKRADQERADILVRAARNQANAGNYEKAVAYFIESLNLKDLPAVRKELAGVLIKDKKAREAEEWLGDLIYEDDRVAGWLVGGYVSEGLLADAQRVLEAIVEKKPDHFAHRLQLAQVLSWRKLYDKSIKFYRQLIKENPQDDDLYLGYLDTLFWANRYDAYISESSQYLKRKPRDMEVRARRVDLLLAESAFGLAAEECRQILEMNPDNKGYRLRLAQILSWDGKYGESEKIYTELAAAYPKDASVLKGLGEVRVWAQKYEAAVDPLRAVLKAGKYVPQVQRLLAMSLSELKQVSKEDQKWLVEMATRLLTSKEEPRDIAFYTALARSLGKLERYDMAVKLLQKTLQKRPESRGVRLQLADTLNAAGRFAEAEKEYDLLLRAQTAGKETR